MRNLVAHAVSHPRISPPGPVHSRTMLGHPGVPEDYRGVRGVDDQEGDLLLMVPRDPQGQRGGGTGDSPDVLPIKRIGY